MAPGITLAARSASQLVVDAAGFVPLGGEHIQATELDHLLASPPCRSRRGSSRGAPRGVRICVTRRSSGSIPSLAHLDLQGQSPRGCLRADDVDAAARHVGRDRDRPEAARLSDRSHASRWACCLALRTSCLHTLALEQPGDHLGLLDGDRADEDRLALRLPLDGVVEMTALNLPSSVL